MNTFMVILGILIFISLQAIVGWLVRIFDLLALNTSTDVAKVLEIDGMQLKVRMQQTIERIAPGHGKSWAKKIWPGKHMDPDLRSKMDKPKDKVH